MERCSSRRAWSGDEADEDDNDDGAIRATRERESGRAGERESGRAGSISSYLSPPLPPKLLLCLLVVCPSASLDG